MSILSPRAIRERYPGTDIGRGRGGVKIIKNLPGNGARELDVAARVLSAHECRKCSKCCSGGFSFRKKDPHYQEIMSALKGKEGLFQFRRRGVLLGQYFEVTVPKGRKACPFLEGQQPAFSELDFKEGLASEGKGAVFGCEAYSTRPSICASYPFIWETLDIRYWGLLSDESFAALDPRCAAMGELAQNGIGHLTLSELRAISEKAVGGAGNMLSSIAASLAEIHRRVGETKAYAKIFRTEEGDEVYPLNFNEISHPMQEEERC